MAKYAQQNVHYVWVRRRPRLLLMEVLSRLVGITIGSRTNRWREALEQQAGKMFETPQEDKRELKQLKAQNERLLHKVSQLTIDCDFFLHKPARMPVSK